MIGRLITRTVLACAIASLTTGALIVLFTFDFEAAGAGLAVSGFTFPSIALFCIARSSPRWSRFAVVLYVLPAAISILLFAVPALTEGEGRDLAALIAKVLLTTFLIMLPVSAALTAPGAEPDTPSGI